LVEFVFVSIAYVIAVFKIETWVGYGIYAAKSYAKNWEHGTILLDKRRNCVWHK
jgi:hypothetical protein